MQDEVCPWNAKRFALEAGPEGASCRATEAAPELALTAAALASTYLGAVSFSTLEQAGLVEEQKAGALERANKMFAVQQAPWTPCGF